MDKINHLIQVYANCLNDEKMVVEKIKTPENRYYFIPGLKGTNELYALYAMYAEHNFAKARLRFYKAARVLEFATINYDRIIMSVGIYDMADALLSDDPVIINRYSTLRNKTIAELTLGYQVANAAQNILLDDLDKLSLNIGHITRFLKLPRFQPMLGVLDYFNGFKNKDESLIAKGLQTLLAARKQRNIDPLLSRFFSIDTAAYTKVAWLKGYEIDLQSSFVPIELMRIKPLEQYEDYDFLNG